MAPCLLLGLSLALGAPAKDPPKKEASVLGEWVPEKMVAGGKEMPAPKEKITFGFEADGKLIVTEDKEKPDVGSYKIDAKANPPRIDLSPPEGSNEPCLYGIYKLDGDTLTMAVSEKEADRPTKLESPEGSKVVLLVLKRVKKKD
jgi:uncharacterized protein (TIGR03067 family)